MPVVFQGNRESNSQVLSIIEDVHKYIASLGYNIQWNAYGAEDFDIIIYKSF